MMLKIFDFFNLLFFRAIYLELYFKQFYTLYICYIVMKHYNKKILFKLFVVKYYLKKELKLP